MKMKRTYKKFLPAELAEIKSVYPKHGAKGCVLCLKRHPIFCVDGRARRDGVQKEKRRSWSSWTDVELAEVKENYSSKGALGCPIALQRHTVLAVKVQAGAVGYALKRNGWWGSELLDIKKNFAESGHGGCLVALQRHSPASITIKAYRLGMKRRPGRSRP